MNNHDGAYDISGTPEPHGSSSTRSDVSVEEGEIGNGLFRSNIGQ